MSSIEEYIEYLERYNHRIFPDKYERSRYQPQLANKLKELEDGFSYEQLNQLLGEQELILDHVEQNLGGLHVVVYSCKPGWLSSILYEISVVLPNKKRSYQQKTTFEKIHQDAIICEVWSYKCGFFHMDTLPSLRYMKNNMPASLSTRLDTFRA